MRRTSQAGLTLMEVLVAVSLLSLLSLGMVIALRVGLAATAKTDARLIDNRRVAGTQRMLEQEIAGFMPVMAQCGANPEMHAGGTRVPFFEGEAQSMRFVSTYSLHAAWRGVPQIVELLVIPRDDGQGVRLVVNERSYTGPVAAGAFCLGPDRYLPVVATPESFILADKLAFCRFTYLGPAPPPQNEEWRQQWGLARWPLALRIDMAPSVDDDARLRPVTVTQRIEVNRLPDIEYVDQ